MKLRALVILPVLLFAALLSSLTPAAADAATNRPRIVPLVQPLTVRVPVGAPITVSTKPKASAPTTVLSPTTTFGSARVLLATAKQGKWYRVSLPTRPNGSTAWVRARDVSLRAALDHVVIDLAARTLTWSRDGSVALQTAVAVGAPDTPTPRGAFYVTDLLDNADDAGPYGPYALGLSAHSDTLSEFAGGDGQIGVHGTDAPWSIGQPVSHGCVRVPNDVITTLAQSLPLGTPVTIR
jgi:lipoprotein-anchoring transpeptidase ErfK/SrfK